MAGGSISREIDSAGMVGFLLFGSVPEPFTIRRDIRALPAGTTMTVSARGCAEPVRYFCVARIFADAGESREAVDVQSLYARVREALRDSVAHHMIADVPVGAFLSAGIDSGALVGLARDAGVQDLQTLTLAFDEYRGMPDDEAPLAEKVARSYATVHRTRYLGAEEFTADISRIFDAMDQPSIDGVNTYFVSKAAAEQGLKVVLSGLGGDELFAGYNSFIDIPRWVRRLAFPSRIPFLGQAFQKFYSSILDGRVARSPKLAGALIYGGTYPGAWFLRRGVFMPWELDSILPKDAIADGMERLHGIDLIAAALLPDRCAAAHGTGAIARRHGAPPSQAPARAQSAAAAARRDFAQTEDGLPGACAALARNKSSAGRVEGTSATCAKGLPLGQKMGVHRVAIVRTELKKGKLH